MRFLLTMLFLLAIGCQEVTETGYRPRKLGDASERDVRRGYYASPFSPAARDAAMSNPDNWEDIRTSKPGW